jgi:hypothetical protein
MNLRILRSFCILFLPVIVAFAGASLAGADETLTYQDLTHRLTDLERLSTIPADGEKGGMFSSYDRVDQYDAAHDRYIRWCDKCDADRGVIREEGNVDVFAEMQGPGCIWRIWSAGPNSGHVKIYIDGSDKPTIDIPFVQFFKDGPFASWSNLSCYSLSSLISEPGMNFYIPIPFQKSCKITGDQGAPNQRPRAWGGFYQIEYTRYPSGTTMPTFQFPLSPEETAALDAANTALGKCGDDPAGTRPGQQSDAPAITATPGQWTTVADLNGPQAITGLNVKLDLPINPEAQRILLRQLTVRITWDDDKSPSVWSPLGDFFSFVGGGQPYATLGTGLKDDGTFYSHWYMPFASHAKIEVGNDGAQPVSTNWQITRAPLDKPIGELARFHAKWHRDAFPPERKDRAPEWTILTTQGRGRFVGTMLHVWNPLGGWWGEGEARYFVDGEKFPSYFGTGSEDFFGYAWGAPNFFERPYHAQPLNQENYGHIDDIREQIPDNVPFQKSFEGCIEKFARNQGSIDPLIRYDLYAAEAYWYLAPGGIDPYGEIPVDQRVGYWTPPRDTYQEPGAIEAEGMTPVPYDWNSGVPTIMAVWDLKQPNLKLSNDKEMAWTAYRAPGVDRLQLRFPVEKAGRYRVIAHFTKDVHDGIFQFGIDDQKMGQPVDLYSPTLIAADPVELGTADLTAGNHLFTTTLTGKNPAIKDGKPPEVGIDYLKLVPVSGQP